MSAPEDCATCDGSGILTVPDGDGESASEQLCPNPVHDDDEYDGHSGDDGLERVPLGGVVDCGFDAAGGAW